jgi:hypothetical protein
MCCESELEPIGRTFGATGSAGSLTLLSRILPAMNSRMSSSLLALTHFEGFVIVCDETLCAKDLSEQVGSFVAQYTQPMLI